MSTLTGRRRTATGTRRGTKSGPLRGGEGLVALSDLQEGVKGAGSQGDGGQRRRAGGLKGCNGSTATALRPWGPLPPEMAGRQAAASFRIVEFLLIANH